MNYAELYADAACGQCGRVYTDFSYDPDLNEYEDSADFMMYCDTYAQHDRHDY